LKENIEGFKEKYINFYFIVSNNIIVLNNLKQQIYFLSTNPNIPISINNSYFIVTVTYPLYLYNDVINSIFIQNKINIKILQIDYFFFYT